MLSHIRVRNVALIDDLDVDLEDGLNVLSGETGAGKSLILGAVGLALGARASRELLTPGKVSQIDLLFETDSEEILLSRRIGENGRSLNRINDEIVTAASLQKEAARLIDVYGQHENQALLEPSRHVDILDSFAPETEEHKARLQDLLAEKKKREDEIALLEKQAEDRERLLGLAWFEADEIDQAGLREGEEEELNAYSRLARSGVQIQEATQEAYRAVSGDGSYADGAADLLGQAVSALQRIRDLDPEEIDSFIDLLSNSLSLAEEAAAGIHRYGDNLDTDPARLAETEERLDTLRRLKKKYGATYEKIMAYREGLKETVDRLENVRETLEKLEAEKRVIEDELEKAADALTEVRKATAKRVSGEITEILKTLQFQAPEFAVSIGKRDEIGPKGADRVQFLIRTNVGDTLRSLDRIASGGEISRIMLAIKTVQADREEIPTMIFDEIDTGISGRTAQRVAEKLAMIGRFHQVICITHLPQIAAMADNHLCIEKTVRDGRARTGIERLSEEGRIEELARMLGGTEMTKAAKENAAEMLTLAEKWKKTI